MADIAPIAAAPTAAVNPGAGAGRTAGAGGGFAAAFSKALDSANADQVKADTVQRQYQLGDPKVSIEEAMLATQDANISFQALVQVRNRLVSAYHDIMNMQV